MVAITSGCNVRHKSKLLLEPFIYQQTSAYLLLMWTKSLIMTILRYFTNTCLVWKFSAAISTMLMCRVYVAGNSQSKTMLTGRSLTGQEEKKVGNKLFAFLNLMGFFKIISESIR
jgi:hypothetical protein